MKYERLEYCIKYNINIQFTKTSEECVSGKVGNISIYSKTNTAQFLLLQISICMINAKDM